MRRRGMLALAGCALLAFGASADRAPRFDLAGADVLRLERVLDELELKYWRILPVVTQARGGHLGPAVYVAEVVLPPENTSGALCRTNVILMSREVDSREWNYFQSNDPVPYAAVLRPGVGHCREIDFEHGYFYTEHIEDFMLLRLVQFADDRKRISRLLGNVESLYEYSSRDREELMQVVEMGKLESIVTRSGWFDPERLVYEVAIELSDYLAILRLADSIDGFVVVDVILGQY